MNIKKIGLGMISIFSILFLIPGTIWATDSIKWGAYTGYLPSDFTSLQSIVGKKMDYMAVFIHWGNENAFPVDMAKLAKDNNQSLVIYWESDDYNFSPPESDSRYSYDKILSGTYESYIKSFALAAKNSGVPVIIVPFDEMNGNWSSWSVTKNGNTPQKHVAAFRYLKSFFTDASNIKFGWAINNDSVPDTAINQPMTYYPGDDVVDIVGVDGFNFGNPWQSFSSVFDNSIEKLNTINKPMMIFSMASAEGSNKAAWIQDASVKLQNSPVTAWIWFNENKEHDWRVNSDANSLAAFQNYLTNIIVPIPTTVVPSPTPTPTPVVVRHKRRYWWGN